MGTPLRVVILEDRPTDVQLILYELRAANFEPDWTRVDSEEEFLTQLKSPIDVILSDFSMPSFDALRALRLVKERDLDIPFIVVSGSIGEDVAVDVMKQGATDYLLKDRLGRLGTAVQNALMQAQLREEKKIAEQARSSAESMFRKLVDNSLVGVQILQDGKYAFANSRIAEIFGYSVDELRSLDSWADVVAASDRDMVINQVHRRLTGVDPYAHYVFKGLRKDQSVIEVEVRSNRIELHGRPAVLGMLVDITESKRVEAEIQRTTDLLRAIAEWTPDAVFVKDRLGRYLLFNPAAARFVGRRVEDVIGHDDTELFDPEGARLVMDRDRGVMASGEIDTEEEVLTAAGVTRTFLATKAPYRDKQGNIIGVIGISRDITQRKQAEAERDHLLSRLRLQFERMPLGGMLTDAEFRVIDWNSAAERIFGYSKDEILGMGPPFEKIVSPGWWPEESGILQRIKSGDMTANTVIENVTKDGRGIICEWNNTPLLDADGQFIGMFSIAQDITDRRDAEQALKLRDRAIQAVTQGIVITDPGQPGNPIIYVSPSFEKLTGYSTQEVLGRNCRFLQGPGTDPETVARLRRAIRDVQPCKVELLNYRKDGTSFWNELSISPVTDDHGRLTHFVGSQADVTSRRRLEEQLRQVQKMEAVGRLAGGVAHDFNNLLTIINGYSELMLDGLAETDPHADYVQQIRRAGDRAAEMTKQLLAFSRKQMQQPVVLDMNSLIQETEKLLNRLIGADIHLVLDLNLSLWKINADKGQMEQIIMNLILNARDAMPSGGSLVVTTNNVELDENYASMHSDARPGKYVLLAVSDTGCGMDKETMARVFEPFFTTKDADKGTGLGLATVYGIVKQCNGHIDVYSETGLGTTFKVYLPINGADEAASVQPQLISETRRGNEVILLVEDEAGVRSLATQILTSNGYQVLEASNGQEALTVIEQAPQVIQLIITDVVMPGMGGRQLIEQIRNRLPDAKVLFMSGYTEDAIVRHGILSSEAEFLQKPFTAVALKSKVREILDLKLAQ